MSAPSIHIRAMSLHDVRLVLDWAAAEGWNPGLHDVTPFFAADPGGWLVATVDGDAEPAAAISIVRYGAHFAFLGLYIVRPDRRGQGLGWALWQAGMARVAGRGVGLDGVVAQQDNYRRSGFQPAHRNIRFQGAPPSGAAPQIPLMDLATVPFDSLNAYDHHCFGAPREAFLAAWIAHPAVHGLAVRRNGRLAGFGVIRPCRVGWKIGPLFADGPDEAESLFLGLCGRIDSGPVALDAPDINPAAAALAARYGLAPVFETARMYAGTAPEMDWRRVFGVTSLELG